MKKHLFFFILVSSIILSCHSCKFKPDSVKITIVETSDVHGAIFDYNFITSKKSDGSLSKVYTYLSNIKDTTELILVDNGDILQGQPTVYYYNFVNNKENHICSKVMNYMQYDAATVGNHDIEAGHDVYDRLTKEFNFPWLAANAKNKKTGKPYFTPYTVINKQGFKIAFLGLITPGVPNWLPEELWEGIEFEDMVESAKKWVPIIMKKEKPDILVGLFHSGYNYNYENSDYNTYKNENASLIVAKQVPGFDIVFIGHDHLSRNEKIKNIEDQEVLILGPTSGARQVAIANVELNLNKTGTFEKKIQGNIVEINLYDSDSIFNSKFKTEFQEVKEFVSRKVGENEVEMDAFEAIFGPSAFLDFIHDVQLELSGAQISFAAPLSFKDKINKGPIYVSDLFKLYKFENFLYTIKMTGSEIDKYLEYSVSNWFNTMDDHNDNLLLFEKDENGKLNFSERYQSYKLKSNFYNFDVASGIMYTVNVSMPNGEKVEIESFVDGKTFYSDSTYTVAINSYRGNGGGGHLKYGVGLTDEQLIERRISSTEKDIRYYMMKWIEEKRTINPKLKNNWKIEPYDWWIVAKENDKKLLNKNNKN